MNLAPYRAQQAKLSMISASEILLRRFKRVMGEQISDKHIIELGREVLALESSAIAQTAEALNGDFVRAVSLILNCRGRLIVSGIGKSGHIASKIAATFASTGTPAYFVHAAEAAHGDLGMITKDDVVIGISYSGESNELLTLLPVLKRESIALIAMTGNANSTLAQHADVHIDCHVSREACPLNLAPTTSTTVTLALGDALAVACLSAKQFTKEDFARSHPGGSLGRKLLTHVRDVMRTADAVPRVTLGATVLEAIQEMSRKCMGMTSIVDETGALVGIFTEGDLRRLIERIGDIRNVSLADVMTRNPKVIRPEELAVTAVKRLDELQVNQLLVVNDKDELVGALHVHDLMDAKVL